MADTKVEVAKVLGSQSTAPSLASRGFDDDGPRHAKKAKIPIITGRPIPVDFDKAGNEQYLKDHNQWASYKDDAADRLVYLEVVEHSGLQHLASVANQRPNAFAKKDVFKQPESGAPFESLDNHDKLILNARGRVAIRHFHDELVKAKAAHAAHPAPDPPQGSKKPKPLGPRLVPNWVKKLALINATYLPEAATTSVEVSLEFLTNTDRRIGCRYHHNDRFERGPRDGAPTHKARQDAGLIDLHGIAYETFKGTPIKGHAHCGCSLAHVLLDWYIFKTRGATSTNTDPELDMMGKIFFQYTAIPPMPRAYHHATFTALTGLDGASEELYTGIDGWGLVPGDWKTPAYNWNFHMAVLKHTFQEMKVNPYVLFAPPKDEEPKSKVTPTV